MVASLVSPRADEIHLHAAIEPLPSARAGEGGTVGAGLAVGDSRDLRVTHRSASAIIAFPRVMARPVSDGVSVA